MLSYLHEVLDVDGPALLVEASGLESVGKNDVWGGDGLGIISTIIATFSGGVGAEEGLVDGTGLAGDDLAVDFEDDVIDDLDEEICGSQKYFELTR